MTPRGTPLSPRQYRMSALLAICQQIRECRREVAKRGRRTRGTTEAAWRLRRASKLRMARLLAWEYFEALPEFGTPGCCRSPWVFESVRVKR